MNCRHCNTPLTLPFLNLGSAPPSNAYLTAETFAAPEPWFPLRVLVCDHCWLVQTEDFANAHELFDENYAYFSGFSDIWLAHSKRYVNDMIERFRLNANSHVVEVAANDGYLLQYVKERGIPCTGIEPTASTARAARAKGLDIVQEFFGVSLAQHLLDHGKQADLMVANNVLAHVPDINDFVSGFTVLLKDHGVCTFEFPHFLKLVEHNQFDTIYHEHFSYPFLTSVERILRANGLSVFDVEEHPTHGGSLRVFAQRTGTGKIDVSPRVGEMISREIAGGLCDASTYANYQQRADRAKNDFLSFLIEAKRAGKTVAGYGAAAKGATLINYAGVKPDLISFIADRNPAKQNKFSPGSKIPIVREQKLRDARPDFIIIFPWNLKEEVMAQLDYVREWGGRFVTAIPGLEISP